MPPKNYRRVVKTSYAMRKAIVLRRRENAAVVARQATIDNAIDEMRLHDFMSKNEVVSMVNKLFDLGFLKNNKVTK